MRSDAPIAVPRIRVFTLKDGRFVVQWEENRIQDLLNGKYERYVPQQAPDPITDYELNQLKQAGVISAFDEEVIHVYSGSRFVDNPSTRNYYLNTTRHKADLQQITQYLERAGLQADYSVRVQELFVIIRRQDGRPFTSFDDAEKAREHLAELGNPLLKHCVVAFQELFQSE